MADGDNTNGDPNPGGTDPNAGGEPAGGGPGGTDQKKLENLGVADLVGMVLDLRKEAGDYRTRASKAEGSLGDLTKKVKDLEDKAKTDEEKEAERVAARDALAAEAEKLSPYRDHVKTAYEAKLAKVDALEDKDPRKTAFKGLLGRFPEEDYLGRLSAIEALEAAAPTDKVPAGDHRNPGETGGGETERSMADRLKLDPHFLKMGQMTGLVPKTK